MLFCLSSRNTISSEWPDFYTCTTVEKLRYGQIFCEIAKKNEKYIYKSWQYSPCNHTIFIHQYKTRLFLIWTNIHFVTYNSATHIDNSNWNSEHYSKLFIEHLSWHCTLKTTLLLSMIYAITQSQIHHVAYNIIATCRQQVHIFQKQEGTKFIFYHKNMKDAFKWAQTLV